MEKEKMIEAIAELIATADYHSPPSPWEDGVVFVDFGRNRVYAISEDSEDVVVFNSISEVVEKLQPAIVILDDLPSKLQNITAELAKSGVTFVRLKNLEKLSEERKNNGIRKVDENDVKLLREICRRYPEDFQPLFISPEELEVRALTELWVELARQKKSAKRTRTATDNPVAVEAHRPLGRLTEKLTAEIHEEALKLPLYKRAVEELGLKGPSLAYIVSHDGFMLRTLPRGRLAIRYGVTKRRWKGRSLRSQLLIMLASAAVLNKHPRYINIYENYRQKGKKHWETVLRVALRILRDLSRLAKDIRRQTPDT